MLIKSHAQAKLKHKLSLRRPKIALLRKKKKGTAKTCKQKNNIENGFYYEKIHESVKKFLIIV